MKQTITIVQYFLQALQHKRYVENHITKGSFTEDVRLTPGEGGFLGIRTFNCYTSVILLFNPDAGGSRNPGFSRKSFVNGP